MYKISWINKLSVDVWFVIIRQYLAKIQQFLNLESEGATFFSILYIYGVQYPNKIWHKIKIDYFDPYNVLVAITHATLIFVVQGHI